MNKKLFIGLAFAFFLTVIVGTLSHELGHYALAKYFGYDATISFASTNYEHSSSTSSENHNHSFWIRMGGPIQTMLTGTIGLVFIAFNFKRYQNKKNLLSAQWLAIFATLFWLRPTVNFVVLLFSYFTFGNFSMQNDEIQIAKSLNFPLWSLSAATALLGFAILVFVYFRLVPVMQRRTFILAGLVGGIMGYLIWMVFLGKYLLP